MILLLNKEMSNKQTVHKLRIQQNPATQNLKIKIRMNHNQPKEHPKIAAQSV